MCRYRAMDTEMYRGVDIDYLFTYYNKLYNCKDLLSKLKVHRPSVQEEKTTAWLEPGELELKPKVHRTGRRGDQQIATIRKVSRSQHQDDHEGPRTEKLCSCSSILPVVGVGGERLIMVEYRNY